MGMIFKHTICWSFFMQSGYKSIPSAPRLSPRSLAKAQKQGLNENPPPAYGAADGYHLLGGAGDHKTDNLPPFKPSPHVASLPIPQPSMLTPSAPSMNQIEFYPPPPSYAEATAKKGDNKHPKYQNVTYTQYYGSGSSSSNFYIYYMDGYEVRCAAQLMEFQIQLLSNAASGGMHLTSDIVQSLRLGEGMSLVGHAGLEAINFTVGAAGEIAQGLVSAAEHLAPIAQVMGEGVVHGVHAVAQFDADCCTTVGHCCCSVVHCCIEILPTICHGLLVCCGGCCQLLGECLK